MFIFFFLLIYYPFTFLFSEKLVIERKKSLSNNPYPLEKVAIVDLEYIVKKINSSKIQTLIKDKKDTSKKSIDLELEKIKEKKALLKNENLDIRIKKNYIIDIENSKSNISRLIYLKNEKIKQDIEHLNKSLIKLILIEIEKIRVKNNYTFILDKKSILALNPKIEITSEVLSILKKKIKNNNPMEINFLSICKKLPHKSPFLFINSIISTDLKNKEIKSIKNVKNTDPFIELHFPKNPVYPGIFLIEGFAQTALLLQSLLFNQKKIPLTFLSQIDSVKFRQPVFPGNQIVFYIKKIAGNIQFGKFTGNAFVKSIKVASATFTCISTKKKSSKDI